jgi:hypothetical protein
MKQSRMEIHKQLRKEIQNENKLVEDFNTKMDKEIEKSLKKLYVAFPKLQPIVDEKIEKKYDFEQKTLVVNKARKNIKLTKRPSMVHLDELNDSIKEYKKTYTITDEKLNDHLLEVKSKIIKSFSNNYNETKDKLKLQKNMLDEVSISNIENIRQDIHNILVKIVDKSVEENSKEAIEGLRQEYDTLKKDLKHSVKSGDGDIGNTLIADLEKLEGVEKTLDYKGNFKKIKISLFIVNVLILTGLGVSL